MENERRSFVSQTSLSKIPGSPIGYWLSSTFIDGWSKFQYLSNKLTTREGMATADNDRFLRLWFEPGFTKIDLRYVESKENSAAKWFPYNKGGDFRRWYGNIIYVVNWENDGYDIKNNIDENTGRIRSHNYNGEYAFHEGLTWTALSSGLFAIRYSPAGFLWDSKGAMGFTDYKNECLSFLNSIVARQYLKVIAGTKDYKVGDIIMLPYNPQDQDRETFDLCNNNISISKQDWDAHETSWDFAENELIRICKSSGKRDIEALISLYIQYWENQLRQLHTNEEKLNRKFIEIFGLQDELLPDVPLKEISILQEGEVDIDENSITWNKDVIIKQLISYAIGCMMGRYRLDRPKIQIAHQNPTQEEIAPYEYNGEMFTIDDDGIIPIVEEDGIFDDNALDRMNSFIGQVFGRDNIENANTMNNHLGNNVDLKKYLCTKFYADHLSMYSNLPIYWQFSSKVCAPPRSRSNGAFKALVYIHRMTPFTLQVLHDKYLMHYISRLDGIIKNAEQDNSFNQREIDLLKAKLAECRAYEPILKNLADQQIAIELDNGIAKNYELFQEVLSKRK